MLFSQKPPLLHVACPQTNSRYIRRILSSSVSAREVVAPDSPAWAIEDREEYATVRDTPQLLRFGAVRDPWTWYAAVWGEAVRLRGEPGRRAVQTLHAWTSGTLRFRDFVYGATHPEKLLDVPAPLGVVWEPDASLGWQGLRASTLGLCSFTYLYHYGRKAAWQAPTQRPDFAVDVLVDAARVDEALTAILGEKLHPPVLPRETEEEEGSTQDHARAVLAGSYDAEMVRWVADADGPVCRLMGYETPFLPSSGPTLVPVRSSGARRRGPGGRLTRELAWKINNQLVLRGGRPNRRLEIT